MTDITGLNEFSYQPQRAHEYDIPSGVVRQDLLSMLPRRKVFDSKRTVSLTYIMLRDELPAVNQFISENQARNVILNIGNSRVVARFEGDVQFSDYRINHFAIQFSAQILAEL